MIFGFFKRGSNNKLLFLFMNYSLFIIILNTFFCSYAVINKIDNRIDNKIDNKIKAFDSAKNGAINCSFNLNTIDKLGTISSNSLSDRLESVSLDNQEVLKDNQEKDSKKSLIDIVRSKSVYLYSSIINLMFKCDKYIEFWQYRKKNINLYLLSNGQIGNILKAKRDLVEEIKKKIKFFESKKSEYAIFAGKVYKIAETFIEGGTPDLKEDQINIFVQEFTRKIDDALPENYTQDYFMAQKKELKAFIPDDKAERMRKKYYLAGAGTIVGLTLIIIYRKVLANLIFNFWSNNIVKPIRGFRDWFLTDSKNDAFLSLTPEQLQNDLEAQRDVLLDKIEDFAKEVNPKIRKEALDKLLQKAKEIGVESVVAKCIKRARIGVDTIKTKTKPGWIEWLVIGDKLTHTLGMSAKAKLLEVEIKALMSRILATKILVDAKDAVDSNRLALVVASFLPMIATGFGIYKGYNFATDLYNGIPKKKMDIDTMVLKIGEILNKNMCEQKFDDLDQGLLCYYVSKLKKSLDVIPKNVRLAINKDLSYITSNLNLVDKKFQIFQGMKIILYIK